MNLIKNILYVLVLLSFCMFMFSGSFLLGIVGYLSLKESTGLYLDEMFTSNSEN